MPRISKQEYFMRIADASKERATCPRLHVGAVIVKDGRMVSTGYCGSPRGLPHCEDVGCEIGPDGGCIRTTHAEQNAIINAAYHGVSTKDSEMYVTDAPCYTCAKMIINAGIKKVFYKNPYRKTEGIELLQKAGIEVEHYNPFTESK